jgi:membrane protein YqaA with SNARE-associated domain
MLVNGWGLPGAGDCLDNLPPASHPPSTPVRSPWILPGLMLGITILALLAAQAWADWSQLIYLVPYTFLGNSLAPLPYDGAVLYLGGRYSLVLIVLVAVLATLLIEAWNMELLGRLLAREGTRPFRAHRVTQWSLRWYRKAPFWSLVATCIIPIIPHYPMRFLAVLAGYPLWKYQLSVVLGRGARYVGLAGVGVAVPIPGIWIAIASLVLLAFGIRGARRMNRTPDGEAVIAEEA